MQAVNTLSRSTQILIGVIATVLRAMMARRGMRLTADVHRAHRHLNPPENIRRRGRDACHKGVLAFGRYTTTERLGLLGVPLLCI